MKLQIYGEFRNSNDRIFLLILTEEWKARHIFFFVVPLGMTFSLVTGDFPNEFSYNAKLVINVFCSMEDRASVRRRWWCTIVDVFQAKPLSEIAGKRDMTIASVCR